MVAHYAIVDEPHEDQWREQVWHKSVQIIVRIPTKQECEGNDYKSTTDVAEFVKAALNIIVTQQFLRFEKRVSCFLTYVVFGNSCYGLL